MAEESWHCCATPKYNPGATAQRESIVRPVRFLACLFLAAFFASTQALPQEAPRPQRITIAGKLTHVMGIGGETTGWALQLRREIRLEGKKMDSIEISGPVDKFEKLNDQRVKARGTITHHKGVERGEYLVLEVSSIRAVK
jgi:hypothetical protein